MGEVFWSPSSFPAEGARDVWPRTGTGVWGTDCCSRAALWSGPGGCRSRDPAPSRRKTGSDCRAGSFDFRTETVGQQEPLLLRWELLGFDLHTAILLLEGPSRVTWDQQGTLLTDRMVLALDQRRSLGHSCCWCCWCCHCCGLGSFQR